MRSLLLLASLALMTPGCEEPKPHAPAASSASPSAAPAPTPTPTPSAEALPPKKEVVCPRGPAVEFREPLLEAEVRRKLSKPTGTINVAFG
jgi:hypothetical protein